MVDKVKNQKGAQGFNAASEEYEDLIKAGVIDPTKVVRTALQNAAMAIASGLCDHVLVTLGWNGYSALRPKPGAPPTRPMNMNTLTNTIQGYYIPYGVFLPVQMYAWLATRLEAWLSHQHDAQMPEGVHGLQVHCTPEGIWLAAHVTMDEERPRPLALALRIADTAA